MQLKGTAQSCCSSTGSISFARVAECQRNIMSIQSTYTSLNTKYNSDGNKEGITSYDRYQLNLRIGLGYRFGDIFQVNTIIPWRFISHSSDFDDDKSIGLSDLQFGGMFHVNPLKAEVKSKKTVGDYLPAIDLLFSFKSKTGTPIEKSESGKNRTDVTSDGLYGYNVGIFFGKLISSKHLIKYKYDRWYFGEDLFELESLLDPEYEWELGYNYIYSIFHSGGVSTAFNTKNVDSNHFWSVYYSHFINFPRFEIIASIDFLPPYEYHNSQVMETGNKYSMTLKYSIM